MMSAIEKELKKLQDSLGLSDTVRKTSARDSGIPESRHTTIGDKSLEGTGAKPKKGRKTTSFLEDDEPSFVVKDNPLSSDQSRLSSTPYIDTAAFDEVYGDNVTRRRQKKTEHEAVRSGVKTDKYDGSTSWVDFKSHFEICATLNKWSVAEMGMHLAVSLRGQAQGVLGNLPEGEKCNYRLLCKALEERFLPTNQTELYRAQLRERRQKATETLPELGQEIRRLTNLAYPTAPVEVRETLAKEQFIDALRDRDMRLRVKQARPADLNDAVRHAVELDAFQAADQRMHESPTYARSTHNEDEKLDPISILTKAVVDLKEEIKVLKDEKRHTESLQSVQRRSGQKPKVVCHFCKKQGHVKANCFKYLKSLGKAASKYDSSGREGYPAFRNSRDKTNTGNKEAGKSGVTCKVGEAGMFIHAEIKGKVVKFLVDSGATLSIISPDIVNSVVGVTSNFAKLDRPIVTANGSRLKTDGLVTITFKLGNENFVQAFAVAEIGVDGILGLDFLRDQMCNLDMSSMTLRVRNKLFNLHLEGKIGCCRVTLADNVCIPPGSEIVTMCNVLPPLFDKVPEVGLIEPSCRFVDTDRALVARAVVCGGKVAPIRMMNLSDQAHTIYKGTLVANLTPVDSVCAGVQENKNFVKCQRLPDHIKNLYERTVEGMDSKNAKMVYKLLLQYSNLFAATDADLGQTRVIEHKIDTGSAPPIKQHARRLPVHMQAEVDEHVDDMLKRNVIEESTSPWSSPVVLAKKKDGTTRFCVDYRKLNDVTVKDAYPLPRIDDSIDQLSGVKWFSTLDLNSGYWQVGMTPDDRSKTAFVTRRGLYQFKVMPFGLCNAPATFERLMETVLRNLQWRICLVYLDDIIVVGKSIEDMIQNLTQVFDCLLAAGLKLKARKCTLFARKVEYLGHIISEKGIATSPDKVKAVKNWPVPTNLTELRSFIGFCSYYRRFVLNFAMIAKPLHDLTKKNAKYIWTDNCQNAFDRLRTELSTAPILAHPDFEQEFILDTDASNEAIGAVLSQVQKGIERPIAFASKSLSNSERKYCVTRKELLAVVTFVKYFRQYLYGRKFKVRTDHSSLRWLMNFKDPEGQLARWNEVLSCYDFYIEHRPGRLHKNADSLSRIPCKQCKSDHQHTCSSLIPESDAVVNSITDYSDTPLSEMQDSDRDISKVKKWIAAQKRPEYNDISGESVAVKSLWSQWDRLVLQNDVLCRKWEDLVTKSQKLQAVIPSAERRVILKFCHDDRTAGHLGMHKTLSRIRQSYYWPGLQKDVRQYILGCEICTKRKASSMSNKAPMQLVGSGYPMERIATDILGELPETDKGNRYILVVADYFTKWTECFALPNIEAKTIASVIVEEVITRFGVPDTIHSDQGRQYESELFQETCKLLDIQKTHTTPYHPQSDGMVERFNRTLTTMLSAFVNEHHSDWDVHLPYVMMAYRSSIQETTGMTPNMLMLGRETKTPVDIMYEPPRNVKKAPSHKWVWELQERLEIAHNTVRNNIGQAMVRQKHYHDRKLKWKTFQNGEEVYVFFPRRRPGTSPKFTSFWQGPYKIIRKMSDLTYMVNCGPRGGEQVIHVDRMRKKHPQILAGEEVQETEETVLPERDTAHDTVPDQENSRNNYNDRPVRNRKPPTWLHDYYVDK